MNLTKLSLEQHRLLLDKESIHRIFRQTTMRDGDGDSFLERHEFKALLQNAIEASGGVVGKIKDRAGGGGRSGRSNRGNSKQSGAAFGIGAVDEEISLQAAPEVSALLAQLSEVENAQLIPSDIAGVLAQLSEV